MRVLYLTLNPNRQSTTVPTEGWFRLLGPSGLEPVLVSSQSGAFQQWSREQGVPTYDLAMPFPSRRQPFDFASSLWSLLRIIRRHRIDLVHANEHDVYPLAQYASRLAGLPRVVSVHFTMDRGFTDWAFGRARQPDRVFFVSASSMEVCRPAMTGVVPEERWRVLRNGLDLNRFTPDPGRRAAARVRLGLETGPVIGVACALRPRKQLEHLVSAAAKLARKDVTILLAGAPVAGDESYAASLLAEAGRTLGHRFRHLGHLDDLRDFYNALDLFVNTSQEEACSISVIEALACGCPVVGYASRSVDEQILPDGGEIVPQDDVAALVAALDRWLADSDALRATSRRARLQAERLFDIADLSRYLFGELYQAVLLARGRTD